MKPGRSVHPAAAVILALVVVLLVLAGCRSVPVPVLVPASTSTPIPPTLCPTCAQTTQIAALTQANINASARQAQAAATADILNSQARATASAGSATQSAALAAQEINAIAFQAQSAATADIQRAHALATFNAASSTQGAALTQDSLDAGLLQAQAVATADRLRADALATFNAASSTQSSALTQAALQQAQVRLHIQLTVQSAARNAAATGTQQWIGALVAGTATTLARAMTDQTQSAAAIAQRIADQRQEQGQAPINFLWKWGLPFFILAAALLGLWGFWRWLRMRTTRPRVVTRSLGVPFIVPQRGLSLAGHLPHTLRRMAWLVGAEPSLVTPGRPVEAVVATLTIDAAALPADLSQMPARDQPVAGRIEAESPPTRSKV